MKKHTLWLLCLLLLTSGLAIAQDDTTDTDTSSQSTVQFFFVACENNAVVDLSGVMQPGFDIYVQIFRDLNGTGEPLTNIRQVQVNGNYTVSPDLPYINGEVLAFGQFASMRISIASESNANNTVYTELVEEVQDGCGTPQYSSVATSDAGTTTTTTTTATTAVDASTGRPLSEGIFAPGGTIYFPPEGIVARENEPAVFIGARPSELQDKQNFEGRSSQPGLLFAECDKYDRAAPGTIYDNDNIVIFWSWFAATPELVQDHINNADYKIYLYSDYNGSQLVQRINRSEITERSDGNYWVFYTADLGTGFRPGDYSVGYQLRWNQQISDGYGEYGPGTANDYIESNCTFDIQLNPWGIPTAQNNPTLPLQSN